MGAQTSPQWHKLFFKPVNSSLSSVCPPREYLGWGGGGDRARGGTWISKTWGWELAGPPGVCVGKDEGIAHPEPGGRGHQVLGLCYLEVEVWGGCLESQQRCAVRASSLLEATALL